MKRIATSLALITLLCAGAAHAGTVSGGTTAPKAQLFDTTPSKLVPTAQVGDSVFNYTVDEINCEADDEETPCTATVDHWQTVCFKGDIEGVCPAFKKLVKKSDKILIDDGAEEYIELKSCSTESGIPVLTLDLISGHGGPNVEVKDKMIPMCPIFVQ